MKTGHLLLILASVVVATQGAAQPLSIISELELQAHREFKTLLDHLSFNKQNDEFDSKRKVNGRVQSFSFKNCADPNTEIAVPSNIRVSPDPIKIPGNITVSGKVVFKTSFGSPIKAVAVIEKEVFGVWVKVPCVDNVGSCTYNDLCTMVEIKDCPPQITSIGLSCQCPFPEGSFNVAPVTVEIKESLPVKVSGGVKIHVTATYQSQLLTCVELQLTLA
ncbi:unnamed protein product [Lymnaea stagnalis]|uniref:MD-2-related lipid-recognition domain-containing protein n=1 Tax=Lymnaea stagnalis TaxID=6523 RepID=A0AAV2HFS0_LYMST